jgi:hypothetical protein
MSEFYRLTLRSDPEHPVDLDRAGLRMRLSAVPTVTDLGEGRYHFGEADENGVMELTQLESAAGMSVSIPRPWVMDKGPQVFALVFMIQGWTGWQVFDEQIGETLQREAVLQGLVAMRQARLSEVEREATPRPRLDQTIEPAGGRMQVSVESRAAEEDPKKRSRWRFW